LHLGSHVWHGKPGRRVCGASARPVTRQDPWACHA
jgi:hypothetical protein